MVYIPDDSDFSSFRDQCESLEGWHCRYNKAGVTVWSQGQEESCAVQKIKVSRASLPRPCARRLPRVPGDCPVLEMRSPACLGPCVPPVPGLAGLDPRRCFPAAPPAPAARPGLPLPGSRRSRRVGSPAAAPGPDQPRIGSAVETALPGAHGTRPWCPSPALHPGVRSCRSPRCCSGRFVACQGLDLGCCRGTRRFHHPSGLFCLIYCRVTLGTSGVAAGGWGHGVSPGWASRALAFLAPRIPTPGQGWDPPERGEAEHPTCRKPSCEQGGHGEVGRREQRSGRGSPTAVPSTGHPAAPLLQPGHEEELLPWTETLQAGGRNRNSTLSRAAAAVHISLLP